MGVQGKPPRKPESKTVRKGDHFERPDVERLIKQAGMIGRHRHRDMTMCLFAFRHGMRAHELVAMLEWQQFDFARKEVMILRCKGSRSRDHTLEKDEIAALKKLGPKSYGPVFENERGGAMSENSFFKIVQRAGRRAGLGPHVQPHALRHSCGYELVNRGLPLRLIQDWLGHKNVQNTVRYTQLGADIFRKVRMWA
jgi:type 1 fimbriae regulatory protein FimB/type 1 fimbriae regulatory protein FimE